jgi:hypothetical protein
MNSQSTFGKGRGRGRRDQSAAASAVLLHADGLRSARTPIAADDADLLDVKLDDSGAYWINSAGEIRHCPLAGCQGAPDRLAPAAPNRVDLTLGPTSVFWIESQKIWKVAKP